MQGEGPLRIFIRCYVSTGADAHAPYRGPDVCRQAAVLRHRTAWLCCFLIATIALVSCSEPDRLKPARLAHVTQSILLEDSLGTDDSALFPFGFYIEGHTMDVPTLDGSQTNAGFFQGGAPNSRAFVANSIDSLVDTEKFYEETMRHMRSFGANVFMAPNVDTDWNYGWTTSQDRMKRLVSGAYKTGGIYAIPSSSVVQTKALGPGPAFVQSIPTCQAQTDGSPEGQAAQAVRQTLAAVVGSCTGGTTAGA